ncbi:MULTISPECIES: DUF5455 family protein [unclassified Pseudomonas]|uniref:DUF5455 family protein n=1 Tax=unclassified Pseudomonas TaxID=196821 RepID=UPI0024478032|nr:MULTISPECIES: DUF5455 family protein [unclassified Pseudomonas]MDG9922879.1 DUF5455 family protein [Pseudomonas sp. GD04045]MDH0035757.1 DUF5455 family protein [Pseudomonas sp. GD04019]
MPLPAIIGIPFLASAIGGLFAGLVGFFATWMTKRLALTAAFVVASLALFGTFYAFCWALIQGIRVAAPPELDMALAFMVPSNAPACIGAALSVDVARWVYDWNTRVIQFRLNI